MIQDMQVRNLSPLAQRSYVHHVSLFARHFGKSPERLGPEEIRSYQVYLTNEKKLAPVSSHRFPELSAQLLAVSPQGHWLVEYQDWAAPVLERPLALKNGFALPQTEAGCGLAWDQDAPLSVTGFAGQADPPQRIVMSLPTPVRPVTAAAISSAVCSFPSVEAAVHFVVAEHGEAVSVMRAIKQGLDPDNLMNPGKILPANARPWKLPPRPVPGTRCLHTAGRVPFYAICAFDVKINLDKLWKDSRPMCTFLI